MNAGRFMMRGGLFVAATLLSTILCAQQRPLSAHDLAQKVDSHYNQLHSLKAGFTESYEGMGIRRTESGTLLLLKPGRMKWEYSEPAGKLFLLDGRFAWFYSRGDSQVQRISAKELDDLRSPLRFLLGHTQLERELSNLTPVSYTHLDVYKRQDQGQAGAGGTERHASCRRRASRNEMCIRDRA